MIRRRRLFKRIKDKVETGIESRFCQIDTVKRGTPQTIQEVEERMRSIDRQAIRVANACIKKYHPDEN